MINEIRKVMKEKGFNSVLINDNDPHMSEYIESHYKLRQKVSNFTGSNGLVVILDDEASLFTDGRYYIQAEKELPSTILLKKAAEETTIKYYDYLKKNGNGKTALDVSLFSTKELIELEKKGIELAPFDFSYLWEDRPKRNVTKAFLLKDYVKSYSEKLNILREKMKREKIEGYFCSKLDSISYLFNLRSNDIPSNPSITGYLFVNNNQVTLFTDNIFSEEISNYLLENDISVKSYSSITDFFSSSKLEGLTIGFDFEYTNYMIYDLIKNHSKADVKDVKDILFLEKSIKSDEEIDGLKKAHINDGIALAEFYADILSENDYDEYQLSSLLVNYRKKFPTYLEESFNSICAVDENAALMHYSAKSIGSKKLKSGFMILVDTGGHYLEGTTDITRTFCLNEELITDEIKKCYTLTLKGLINLMDTVFLHKCTGGHLDAICRKPLWKIGLDYKCGTGHGIGHVLNVHEGPRSFAINNQEYRLEKGSYITIEPGVYLQDKFGIRIENDVIVDEAFTYQNDRFMKFENITYVPFCYKLIEPQLLNDEELEFINNYHQEVFNKLKDHVSDKALQFLLKYTCKITK